MNKMQRSKKERLIDAIDKTLVNKAIKCKNNCIITKVISATIINGHTPEDIHEDSMELWKKVDVKSQVKCKYVSSDFNSTTEHSCDIEATFIISGANGDFQVKVESIRCIHCR